MDSNVVGQLKVPWARELMPIGTPATIL